MIARKLRMLSISIAEMCGWLTFVDQAVIQRLEVEAKSQRRRFIGKTFLHQLIYALSPNRDGGLPLALSLGMVSVIAGEAAGLSVWHSLWLSTIVATVVSFASSVYQALCHQAHTREMRELEFEKRHATLELVMAQIAEHAVPSFFISYSESDREFARKLHDDLQRAGVRCWFAPHYMASGEKVHEQIDRAIQVQDRLLLILSEASMSSEWVKTEIANARAKEREQKRQVLFPIGLVPFEEVRKWKAFDADIGKDSAREVREYFIPDFSNWKDATTYKTAFDRLLKDLRARDDQQRE